jgi:hypothetical protein
MSSRTPYLQSKTEFIGYVGGKLEQAGWPPVMVKKVMPLLWKGQVHGTQMTMTGRYISEVHEVLSLDDEYLWNYFIKGGG